MIRPAAITAVLALAAPAAAQGVFVPPPGADPGPAFTGKRAHVARELPLYGFDPSVLRDLSNAKVALIDTYIHSDLSPNDVRLRIGSALRPGILQSLVDRF